jgi:DnaK suppressor protein
MAKAEQMRFKFALEIKRKELVRAIRVQASELVIGDRVHDPIDHVQNMTHRDEAVDNVHRLSRTLSSVESSLHAISEGCYGYCAECGEPIAIKRLEILPWATHCVSCQARLEQLEATGDLQPEPIPPSGEELEAA